MPRTSLNSVSSENGRRVYKEYQDGVEVHSSITDKKLLDRTESRSTTNTPNFRKFRGGKDGVHREDLPMNPFSYSLDRIDHPYGRVTEDFGSGRIGVETEVLGVGENFVPRGITSTIRDAVKSEALSKSLLELKDKKVDLGVMFAERESTGRLVLDSARKIYDAYRSTRRRDLKGALRALFGTDDVNSDVVRAGLTPPKKKGRPGKGISNTVRGSSDMWLQLQYGWKPLLNDVWNSAEALARQSGRPARFRVATSKTHRWQIADVEYYQGLPFRRVENGSFTRKYVYVFSYSNEVIHSLSELGLTNPALVAWELLPFSFVADWFIGIGNYLDTLDATLGLTFEKGCVTDFERWTIRTRSRSAGVAQATGRFVTHAFDGGRKRVICERAVLSDFPSPQLPRFDFSYKSDAHLASFFALLSQRFRGDPRR